MNSVASQSSNSGWVGPVPNLPKSFGLGDDPPAEVSLPDAVDDHAGRQRVVLRRDPVGQHGSPAAALASFAGGGIVGSGEAEHLGETRLNHRAGGVGVAAGEYRRVGGCTRQLLTDRASSCDGSGIFSSTLRSFDSRLVIRRSVASRNCATFVTTCGPVVRLRRSLVLGRHPLDGLVLDRGHSSSQFGDPSLASLAVRLHTARAGPAV